MDLGLAGKVALVTGASRGLGKSVAETLATEGAHVVVASRDQVILEAAAEDIRKSANGDVLAVPTDVTKEKDVRHLVDAATERFDRIDILVANAGGPPASRFETTDVDAWRQGLELNLLSTIHLCRAVVPGMARATFGPDRRDRLYLSKTARRRADPVEHGAIGRRRSDEVSFERARAARNSCERCLPRLHENRPPRRSRRAHERAGWCPERNHLQTMDRPNPNGPPGGPRRIRRCSCISLLGAVKGV